jgi:hypothetical protein
MHKSATKCNETLGKWCKNKHGASKIIDTLETYQRTMVVTTTLVRIRIVSRSDACRVVGLTWVSYVIRLKRIYNF